MNPHENEDQISSLLSEGFKLVDLAFDQFDKFLVPATRDGLKLGYYLLPGISTGEGLFISVVRKIEETESKNYRSCIFEQFLATLIHSPIPWLLHTNGNQIRLYLR
tara:strand:+ start:7098 stop:7415 length:318 start_codon:yes stop_codon:yes gene_type:complete